MEQTSGVRQALTVSDSARAAREAILAEALSNFSVKNLQSDDSGDAAESEAQRLFGEFRSKIEECERVTAHVDAESSSTLTSAEALSSCVHQVQQMYSTKVVRRRERSLWANNGYSAELT